MTAGDAHGALGKREIGNDKIVLSVTLVGPRARVNPSEFSAELKLLGRAGFLGVRSNPILILAQIVV